MTTKTSTITVTGNLSRCTLKRRPVPRRFTRRYDCEQYDVLLDCVLRTDDGRTIFFRTPPARMHVMPRQAPTFRESKWTEAFPADHPWLRVQGDGRLGAKVQLGERVTIQGRIKAEEPRMVLFFVKHVI